MYKANADFVVLIRNENFFLLPMQAYIALITTDLDTDRRVCYLSKRLAE